MAFFNKLLINQLYLAESTGDDKGSIAFVLPSTVDPGGVPIELHEALSSTTYSGTFVFSAGPLPIGDKDKANTFVTAVYDALNKAGVERAFIWWQPVTSSIPIPVMGINFNGTQLGTGLAAQLADGLVFTVQNGMALSWKEDTTLLLNGVDGKQAIDFSGSSAPDTKPAYKGTLPFAGPLRGCIQFSNFIKRQSLYEQLNWGFQYMIPVEPGQMISATTEWLPLAATDNGATDYIGFSISMDPSDIYNAVLDPCQPGTACSISGAYGARRTFFNFTGSNYNDQDTVLASYFQTTFGSPVQLLPQPTGGAGVLGARLVLAPGAYVSSTHQNFLLLPEGDFIIQVPGTTEPMNYYLIGGLQGTEFFIITPKTTTVKGDTLRFLSRQPAFAARFPFETASPVKAPQDPAAPLLEPLYTTSWATLVNSSGNDIIYVAQPKGSALFGNDPLVAKKYTDLFGHDIPGFIVEANDTILFPLAPYQGAVNGNGTTTFTADQITALESQVLSPLRRAAVGTLSTARTLIPGKDGVPAGGDTQSSTTPSGLVVTITKAGNKLQWNEVLLGQNTDNGIVYLMKFVNPDDTLVQALQSSDLMLVAANATHLGAFNDTNPGVVAFLNSMSIGSWEMQANVGKSNRYNDYRNVMLIKGRRGKLYDPADLTNSLVANPQKWTATTSFSAPTTLDQQGQLQPPDPDQLVILSQWLQTYCIDAGKQAGNNYFDNFNTIVQDENWTGILFLRMDITNLPANLAGIMAGVTAPDAFNAHHLGISISPVKKGTAGATVDKASTIFGLIYYVDPDFEDITPAASIQPASADLYDFRLLTLKVLFENTTVSSFESLAQLTLNQLFKMPVSKMGDGGNTFNNVLLSGSLQITNDQTIYSLATQGSNTFYFNSNIINKVQLATVQLSTRNADKDGNMVSWFSITGFIDFFEVYNTVPTIPVPFDVFSFGNKLNEDLPNMGLRFSNLGVSMTFPVSDPVAGKVMLFDTSGITFDASRSTPRKYSIFTNLALDLQGLIAEPTGTTLQSTGYLNVITDLRMAEPVDSDWYGLRYKLNMGSAGELAGKLNLESYVLISWGINSTGTSYSAATGISLPGTGGGAKLISLQSVLKLSIGQIRLTYDDGKHSFLLLFTEIALKFLGLLKIPPSGSTLFYLFGNPDAGGKASGLGWYAMYRIKQNA